jgi:hypothetical protein
MNALLGELALPTSAPKKQDTAVWLWLAIVVIVVLMCAVVVAALAWVQSLQHAALAEPLAWLVVACALPPSCGRPSWTTSAWWPPSSGSLTSSSSGRASSKSGACPGTSVWVQVPLTRANGHAPAADSDFSLPAST